jgi:hypothetical protein
VARPPIATERLFELPDGRILYRLRHRWRDGTTHVVFEPLDLVGRLAALVPPPRANTVRYHGVLAPCAGWRDVVVRDRDGLSASGWPPPSCPCRTGSSQARAATGPLATKGSESGLPVRRPAPPASAKSVETGAAAPEEEHRASGPVPLRERRLPWSELLRRVFAIDAFRCDRCGGRMRILAAIDQPEVIHAILDCLGLNSRAPPLTPAPSREPTDFELGFVDPWPSDEPADDG